MAKKEADRDEEKDDGEPGGGAEKKGVPLSLVILLVVLVGLGGGGLYAWKAGILNRFLGGEKQAHASRGEKKEVPLDVGPTRSLDTFIVNLADPLGKRYLKVKMDLELSDEKVIAELDKRLPQLRDTILTTLSSKTYEEIGTLEGKMQLRMEIMARLNQYLKAGKIKSIYFTDFIVQ
ncbi:MAG: flagellar basal body-associated FliL family protein [Thermodesulfobacteriota bacterium]